MHLSQKICKVCADSHCYYTTILKVFFSSLQAVVDACKIMGKKKFYHQIMEDERLFQKFKITDEIDIVTLKDYMQVSNLDLDLDIAIQILKTTK